MSEVDRIGAVGGVPAAEQGRSETGPRSEDHQAGLPGVTGSSLMDDPTIRMLTVILLGIIALFLTAVASALAFGFLSPPSAPRTLLERSLSVYSAQVKAGNADAATWAAYIGALVDAGQLTEARTVLNQALKSAQSDKSAILLQEARLEYSLKDYPASAKAAEAARIDAEKQQAAKLAELKAKGIKEKPSSALPSSWLPAVHQKADALVQMGENAQAIEAYSLYLRESPADSTILVARGEVELKSGDKASAERDFREALKYIPDYQPALDALEQMGATGK
jgi:tetratricopeptide (TPR) repeat protein